MRSDTKQHLAETKNIIETGRRQQHLNSPVSCLENTGLFYEFAFYASEVQISTGMDDGTHPGNLSE